MVSRTVQVFILMIDLKEPTVSIPFIIWDI